jgi:hypothetical protein
LAAQIEESEIKQGGIESNAAALENTGALLTRLRERLDQPLTYERKRQLVELLVSGIRIETIRTAQKRENIVTVTYRFPSVVDTCADMRACNKRNFEYEPGVPANRSTSFSLGVQDVPSSNLGGPTKFLKDLQTADLPEVAFWSPLGVQKGRQPKGLVVSPDTLDLH